LNSLITPFFIILVQKQTFIDCEVLADFFSNIPQVANDWAVLGKVLGAGEGVVSYIKWQVNANSSSTRQAISDLLCDWTGRMGLYGSTVSLLCYGSADSPGTGVTKGLKNIGFDWVAGIKIIQRPCYQYVCLTQGRCMFCNRYHTRHPRGNGQNSDFF
jgi:hypothetical protein